MRTALPWCRQNTQSSMNLFTCILNGVGKRQGRKGQPLHVLDAPRTADQHGQTVEAERNAGASGHAMLQRRQEILVHLPALLAIKTAAFRDIMDEAGAL